MKLVNPKTLVSCLALLLLAGCGGGSKQIIKPGQPLDPQGNWQFTLQGQQSTMGFAGQLYELHSPIVTSNPMGATTLNCPGSLNPAGQASGVNTIDLTVTQSGANTNAVFSLTGTIADSQTAMSGTWASTNTGGCIADTNGTWTANLIPSVTGTYSGTGNNGMGVTLVLVEDTDQTSQTMGQLTGSVTLTNTACFDLSSPLSLPAWSANGPASIHEGQIVNIHTAPDANGAFLTNNAGNISGTYTINGGPCTGQTFAVALQ